MPLTRAGRMQLRQSCTLVQRTAGVPGWSRVELTVGDTLLEVPDERVVPLFQRLCNLMQCA